MCATITPDMILNGKELAGFIKERQAKDVRRLNAGGVTPKLAIVFDNDAPAIQSYMRIKHRYGEDIGIVVEQHQASGTNELATTIERLNQDSSVHGIIVQLPLVTSDDVDSLVNAVAPQKDVDGLAKVTSFVPATPTAILWLLAGYNVELKDKSIAVVGEGRLVGRPLIKALQDSGREPEIFTSQSNLGELVNFDVIITATGQPKLISNDRVKEGAAVVDAGTASEGGKVVGDVDPVLYERKDIKVSPNPGGVGPLTVCALFDNVLQAARQG